MTKKLNASNFSELTVEKGCDLRKILQWLLYSKILMYVIAIVKLKLNK